MNVKRVRDSVITISAMMQPQDANLAGNVHGGVIMKCEIITFGKNIYCERRSRMNFKSIDEVIHFAKEKENEAADFYDNISKLESFSGSKELLESFAKEERKHYVMLENLGNNKEILDNYQFQWIRDLKRSDYLIDIKYQDKMTYRDLLRLAMKREEKALSLYNKMAEYTENPEYLKLFKMLCQEEAKHKNALETLYDDFMAAQGD